MVDLRKRYTSPAGRALYPFLTQPDTRFDDDGKYAVKLIVPPEEGQEFANFIDTALEQHVSTLIQKKKPADPPYIIDDDGSFIFNFKIKAWGGGENNRWRNRVAIYDSKKRPVDPENINIGNDTIMKVGFSIYCWEASTAGISLQPAAVQIIKLVEYDPSSADNFGFDEEDGFEISEIEGEDIVSQTKEVFSASPDAPF